MRISAKKENRDSIASMSLKLPEVEPSISLGSKIIKTKDYPLFQEKDWCGSGQMKIQEKNLVMELRSHLFLHI